MQQTLKESVKKELKEISENHVVVLLILLAGGLAYFISRIDPGFDALFLGLFLGIIIGSVYRSEKKDLIAQKALSVTLPLGIVLYGSNIVFPRGVKVPAEYIAITLFSVFLLSSTVYALARLNGVGRKFTTLLICGNAICGASAIAIASSLINPRKEEFSASIIIITVVGLTGALIYPSLYYLLGLSQAKYALLSGATLQQTGLVKIATKSFGEELMNLALGIKAVRIAMIALAALIVAFLYSHHRFYVPWYVVAFILMAFFSQNLLPTEVIEVLQPLSTFAFALTLASIGFSVNVSDIQNVRLTPLMIVYIGWLISTTVVLLLISFI
ncbi:MAG: putative sulfate exporter family transporter [Archaeoglobus sp.]|nr:putative sulfate exporter family transporter [Archaeoglobus sp.]